MEYEDASGIFIFMRVSQRSAGDFFPDFALVGALALAAGEPGGIGLLEFHEPWMPGTEPVPGIKKSKYLLLTRQDRVPCPCAYILRGGSLVTRADLPALAGAHPPSLSGSGMRCRAMGRRGTIPHPPLNQPAGMDTHVRPASFSPHAHE